MKFRRAVAFHLEARRFVGIGSERHCGTNWTNCVRVVGSSRFVHAKGQHHRADTYAALLHQLNESEAS